MTTSELIILALMVTLWVMNLIMFAIGMRDGRSASILGSTIAAGACAIAAVLVVT